ncbi:ATP-binding protein [Herbiconiux sp. L3-i23]|uniref:ATP-binding protein n=1 Tax=Herbiconiux sp. L3-i23 TaxID=2905871 RepID=UPI0020743975|nr:ATP-binding protein [Herbiconiux sp. L3-i23]
MASSIAESVRARGDDRPIVLLDGGSGAGKSTLATPLAAALGAELVRLDDVYPGWDGLEAGSEAVHTEIIPLSRWHRWDWNGSAPAERHHIDDTRPLIVEGCGALSRAARRLATFGIWIDLDPDERRRRAIARDGDTYEPHWERWAEQERAFFLREHPDRLADLVLDGHRVP